MSYYVRIRHPHRIGETILVVPTGKTRTTNGAGVEAEGRVISPKTNLEIIWFAKKEIIHE